jgi:hypothetical protein
MNKLLSLIIGARNDTFMGDFQWRLRTTLNFIADSLEKIGRLDDVEVVVCDWGSEVPLQQVLDLTAAARQMTRFVIVPPDRAETLQKDSPFPIPIVQNIVIRRSQGTYIAQTDSDVLFTPLAIERLLMVLDRRLDIGVDPDKALLVASRKHVAFELGLCGPSQAEIEEYLNLYGAMVPVDNLTPGIGTPSALALMHRSLWDDLGGYDERLIYWGWMEIDLYLRVNQKHPWRDLANVGVVLYHMEHYPNNDRSAQTRKFNPVETPGNYRVNDRSWGYAEETFRIGKSDKVPDSDSIDGGSVRWRRNQLGQLCAEQIQLLLCDEEIAWRVGQIDKRLKPNEPERDGYFAGQQGWGYREALAWYAQQMNPLRYLEIGIGASDACFQVGAQYPPVSICGIWVRNPETGHWPFKIPNDLGDRLMKVGHRGYVRHIYALDSRNIATTLENNLDEGGYDLIFVHPWLHATFTSKYLPWLARIIRPGGAIILPCHHPAQIAGQLRECAVQNQLLFFQGYQTLLIIKAEGMLKKVSPDTEGRFHQKRLQNLESYERYRDHRPDIRLAGKIDSGQNHYYEALDHYIQKDYARALEHFKRAVFLQPHCDEYRKTLAKIYLTIFNDPMSALIQYYHARRICPADETTLLMSDRIWNSLENPAVKS